MNDNKFSQWPSFGREEIEAVKDVLLSSRVNYWTGDQCRLFEKEFAARCQAKYAIALANGTVALDLALKALGIGMGDEVIVTPRTFIASASCIVNVGAKPIFADVDNETQNITASTISDVLSSACKAIVVVHLAGMPAEMDEIMSLARSNGLYVIEDCAQAHGAEYKNRPVGSIGDVGCWSFCQDKIMTTGGEGGMVTTNSRTLWSKMWSYKDHGKSWNAVYERNHPPGFRWLHESFGTNWRMTEMQAAIGRIQLGRLTEWRRKRQAHSAVLEKTCQRFGALRVPEVPDYVEHAYYKYYVFVRPENLKADWNRDLIIEAISALGVPVYQGSCSEVYLERAFDEAGLKPRRRLPVARELGETSLMFLVHPTLTDNEIQQTNEAITQVLNEASA